MLHEYCLWCFLLGHSEESHNPHNYLKHSRSRQVVKFIESEKIEVRIFLSGSQNQADPTIFIKMGSAVFSSGKILHKMYHVLNSYMPHIRKHCLVQGKLQVKQ